MTTFKQTTEWTRGKWGEDAVRDWAKRNGFWLIPTTDIENGGAPKAITAMEHDPVLPDFLASRQGEQRILEVKTKEFAPLYQRFQRYQHGVGLRHWDDYQAVAQHFGMVGYLAIVELHRGPNHKNGCRCEPLLLMGRFSEIAVGMDRNESAGVVAAYHEPMAFFDRGRFELLQLTEDGPEFPTKFILPSAPLPPRPKPFYIEHPWEKGKQAPGVNDPKQGFMF